LPHSSACAGATLLPTGPDAGRLRPVKCRKKQDAGAWGPSRGRFARHQKTATTFIGRAEIFQSETSRQKFGDRPWKVNCNPAGQEIVNRIGTLL
jgi:hypothetical protein